MSIGMLNSFRRHGIAVSPYCWPGIKSDKKRVFFESNDAIFSACAEVAAKTCQYFDVDKQVIFKKDRTKDVVRVRHICIYLMREIFNVSYPNMATFFGVDHTSCIHAVKSVKRELSLGLDENYRKDIESLRCILT